MFVDFFIRRPVLTIVSAIVVLIVGAISIPTLPVEQYPDISPVQVLVSAEYIGASAPVVEETVTTVLEREINGVQGMRYMSSISGDDGTSSITVTFEQGYSVDIAAVDVLSRVSIAEPQLPDTVRETGVSVSKQSSGVVLGIPFYSEDDQYDEEFISNYADLYILDRLRRIKGVAELEPFGERRLAMRIWLDPDRLASRSLTAQDVVDALEEQNLQVGAGNIGQPPAPDGQMYQLSLQAVGRLREVSEFEDIVLRTEENRTLIRLRDVGRAEFGAENYNTFTRWNGKRAVGYQIRQIPGGSSNALEIAKAVKAELAEIKKDFPPGLNYDFPYDPTQFIVEARKEVIITLIQAIVLVVIVLFLFLQNWRITLIPACVIPISLIGTFAFVKVFDFSLNSLTLFGLTLATGMVVDDAIVVVEEVASKVQEQGMKPHLAAIDAMRELSGAVIATSLVLLAVFVPVAFFPGTTGQLYKQFALTIAFSIVISTFNALTLTPALSALLVRPKQELDGWLAWLNWVFTRMNQAIDLMRRSYQRLLYQMAGFKLIVLALFVASLGATSWLYVNVPTAFLPDEDQGMVLNIVQGPDGTSLEYTQQVTSQIEPEVLDLSEVRGAFTIGGFGFTGNNPNNAIVFAPLKSWDERTEPEQSQQGIIEGLTEPLSQILKANIISTGLPAIQGLGSFGGFVLQLQDRGDNDLDTLVQFRDELVARANERPELQGVFSTYTASSPKLQIEINRERAKVLHVSIDDILNTLQSFLGSRYVNDFNAFRRTYRVYIQADRQFRSNPEDIGQLYVRSQQGEMILLSNLVRVNSITGAQTINHYNLFRAIEINGSAAPGYSSGQAIAAMEELAEEILPNNIGYEWSGISLEEVESGGQAPYIFGLGILFVFLVLAAQYENFVDPFIILLAVPLAVLGALLAQSLRGLANDVYCQVGLVMLIGLASKNAILIVEFANQLRDQGLPLVKATVEAAQQRLRPIIMTAVSTLIGIFPLTIATGAGAASRQSLGTAVFGGMIVSTFLSLLVVPILYVVIGSVAENFNR
ncbi:MAG: efflux RND transporter permease subunit [Cyanobacteria bacterium P01_A01_bin.40]